MTDVSLVTLRLSCHFFTELKTKPELLSRLYIPIDQFIKTIHFIDYRDEYSYIYSGFSATGDIFKGRAEVEATKIATQLLENTTTLYKFLQLGTLNMWGLGRTSFKPERMMRQRNSKLTRLVMSL